MLAIAREGSMSAAAHALFVSQSSLSAAVREVETETGVTLFRRSNRGVAPTNEGLEFLRYARQVVEQADLLDRRYATHERDGNTLRLAVSTQHYPLAAEAFSLLLDELPDRYSASFRETGTAEVVEDVRDGRSSVGVLHLSNYNRRMVSRAIDAAGLAFFKLFRVRPHVCLAANHPLAGQTRVQPGELEPYPRYVFLQGPTDPPYYAEEPLPELPHARTVGVSDRATMLGLLAEHDGYTLSTGALPEQVANTVVTRPLACDEEMLVGYVAPKDGKLGPEARRYTELLRDVAEERYGLP
jgi:DNA-binding transcriptional LysR family regulator